LITGSWDLSSIIFRILVAIYMGLNFDLDKVIIIYGAIVFIPGIILYFTFNIPQEISENVQLNEPNKEDEPLLPSESPTFCEEIKKPTLWTAWLFMCTLNASGYWYIATFREQLVWIVGENSPDIAKFNNLFALSLPLIGFGSNFIQGYFVGRFSHPVRWIMLGGLSLLWGLLSTIRIIEFQYVICIIFPFWRMFGYVQFYSHIGFFFPAKLFGKLAFGGGTIAGLVTYLNLLFDWVTIHYWNSNYVYLNSSYAIVTTLCSFLAAYFSSMRILKKSLETCD